MIDEFLNWFSMGGYSIYIWPAYGLVCVLLVMNLLGIKWQRRQTRRKLQRWLKRNQS
ncbi:heme exporter protein CcmD [Legionella birminghamensis]|uniref:Heme exporter protein D n=1 Tax=Legionella birminghamensis TaxID=28083 RepID=A0A378I8H0_9GAMM|nr:heme exporter protein CcmD [Legionella birminghamensis]STX31333.1 heme exporter protein CcmD [Legionella birminghamensis]